MENNEHLHSDDFDREYGIRDLLPRSLAAELLDEISDTIKAAVVERDGELVYGNINISKQQLDVSGNRKDPVFLTGPTSQEALLIFPIVHELETIGFLVLQIKDGGIDAKAQIMALGRLASRSVQQVIRLMYSYKMTAGLHCQVVEDSYSKLTEKAEALQLSEEKYRKLAESLETEVENKAREIKETHVVMLQQEKMASIGQLAAGMAHEINNPIGFVVSNLNTLQTNTHDMGRLIDLYQQLTAVISTATDDTSIVGKLTEIEQARTLMDIDFIVEDTTDLIEESLDGAKRVRDIVQNLREFTHPGIETVETANINDCLETTLSILNDCMPVQEVEVDRQFGHIPNISCNIREINQVFFNIIKNAFQAVKDGGRITIQTGSDADSLIVRIIDTGSGIDKKYLGKIFDPFFTTRGVGNGVGLGLTQAYNTIQSHNGIITVESSAGKGSTFAITFPVHGNHGGRVSGRLV